MHIFAVSSAMLMVNVYSSYDEEMPIPRYCFLRGVVGLVGSSSASTNPVPPFRVSAVSEPSVKLINRAFRCITHDKKGSVSSRILL